ncbi:hypothetical protein PC128_g6726 [Phytophthora cactorum]|nr:hypothetical protein PC128_g6726 [Phytophthora cactorum]
MYTFARRPKSRRLSEDVEITLRVHQKIINRAQSVRFRNDSHVSESSGQDAANFVKMLKPWTRATRKGFQVVLLVLGELTIPYIRLFLYHLQEEGKLHPRKFYGSWCSDALALFVWIKRHYERYDAQLPEEPRQSL